MNKLQSVLRVFLVLAIILLVSSMVVFGFYGYRKLKAEQKTLTAKDAELERLGSSQMELQKKLELTEEQEKALAEENARLKADAEATETQKKVILNQVKNSVDSFEEFRVRATDEIVKLQKSIKDMDSQKKALEESLQKSAESTESDRQKMTEQIQTLSDEIASHQKVEQRLKQDVAHKDKAAIVRETAKLHYNLGNFYYRNRNFADAAREYKKALFYDPNDADTHYNLAVLADEVLEDRPTAITNFKKFLELEPRAKDRLRIKERIMDLEMRESIAVPPSPREIGESKFGKTEEKLLTSLEMLKDKK